MPTPTPDITPPAVTPDLELSPEDACTCRHIRAGHAGNHGICLVSVRAEDIGKRRPRPCPCIGFARADELDGGVGR